MTASNLNLHIVLADDDVDDRLFFKDAIEELAVPVQVTTVNDGEELIRHLDKMSRDLPDVLFLDLNMPRKNGFECLLEIKTHSTLKTIPVVIYSTSFEIDKARMLHDNGADYYICKPANFEQLKEVINLALLTVQDNSRSTKDNFILGQQQTGS